MDQTAAKHILDRSVGQVFGYQNPLSLEQAIAKFAFDVRLPQQVFDAQTNEPTWAASIARNNYLTSNHLQQRIEEQNSLRPHRTMQTVDDVLSAWEEVNFATAERQIGSSNVAESDGVYHSENVYRSIDIRKSKNVLFSDGVDGCDHVVAGQTSKNCQYSIRVEDSKNISASFNVNWSNKISRSFFIQDCYDLDECMFCTHLAGKKFCVANIQYSEEEYRRIKEMVIRWIFS